MRGLSVNWGAAQNNECGTKRDQKTRFHEGKKFLVGLLLCGVKISPKGQGLNLRYTLKEKTSNLDGKIGGRFCSLDLITKRSSINHVKFRNSQGLTIVKMSKTLKSHPRKREGI